MTLLGGAAVAVIRGANPGGMGVFIRHPPKDFDPSPQ